MIIQHNISALNSYNKLAGNNKALAKNLEKLSSGYKINRAADDAAGLGISEKMRAQITGMNRAQQNSKDGISLVQTAEGALTEVHSMLNRMVDLTTQASNGVYTNDEKTKIKDELAQLESEIDRIADATNFNGIKLLDGSLSGTGSTKAVSTLTADNIATTSIKAIAGEYESATAVDNSGFAAVGGTQKYTVTFEDGSTASIELGVKQGSAAGKFQLTLDGKNVGADLAAAPTSKNVADVLAAEFSKQLDGKYTVTADTTGKLKFTAAEGGTSTPAVSSITSTGKTGAGADVNDADKFTATTPPSNAASGIKASDLVEYNGTNEDAAVFELNGKKFALVKVADGTIDVTKLADQGVTIIYGDKAAATGQKSIADQLSYHLGMDVSYNTNVTNAATPAAGDAGFRFDAGTSKAGGGGLRLQIGETNDSFNQLDVTVDDCHAAALGVAGLNIDTPDAASASMMKAKAAIEQVSKTRSLLGATQNRLDHTLANLEETTTNLTEAESRIRDTDMANEMMKYTKNNILIQSSQAMLAQANQVPQGVLQLLQ